MNEFIEKVAGGVEAVNTWLREHPPVLAYNTMRGITAVTTMPDYKENAGRTRRSRENGHWKHKFLMPWRITFFFVHSEAPLLQLAECYRAGWVSDFNDLKEGAAFEQKSDLYVPLVGGGGVESYVDELERFVNLHGDLRAYDARTRLDRARRFLIYSHVPTEILTQVRWIG